MARLRGDTETTDLFEVAEVFPVATRRNLPQAIDFNVMLSQLISRALRETDIERPQIAAIMSDMLGESVSTNMLNAYAAPGRVDHNISLVRFLALTRATQQPWLWQEVLRDEGITILIGDEARLAQLGHAEAKMREMQANIRRLKGLAPSVISKRGQS